jgi:hypothetical protein
MIRHVLGGLQGAAILQEYRDPGSPKGMVADALRELHYGFNLDIDRGNSHWQSLEKAKKLRDYYTHIEVTRSRSISAQEVLQFHEAVLLGIIWHRPLFNGA